MKNLQLKNYPDGYMFILTGDDINNLFVKDIKVATNRLQYLLVNYRGEYFVLYDLNFESDLGSKDIAELRIRVTVKNGIKYLDYMDHKTYAMLNVIAENQKSQLQPMKRDLIKPLIF